MKTMDIAWIKGQIRNNDYFWTLHADEERRNDGLEILDVETAILEGEILEQYPQDPRGPSCLIAGKTGEIPVHVVCGKNKAGSLVIITVYRPSFPKWKTPKKRGII